MKKNNLLKMLLLTSVLTTLTACGKPEESKTPSEEPVEEPSSDTVSAGPEDSDTPAPVDEIPAIKLDLNREIYLAGETNLDYSAAYLWSDALQVYKELTSVPTVTMPECPNGLCYATVTSGRKTTQIKIYMYDDAATAAAAWVPSEEELSKVQFKEADYINVSKKTLVYDTYLTSDGELLSQTTKQSADYYNDIAAFTGSGYDWNARYAYAFDEDAGIVSTLDPTRFTVPHEINALYDENGNLIPETDDYKRDILAYSTHFNRKDISGSASDVMHEQEVILDADGNICYWGIVCYNKTPKHTLPTDLTWYCSPKYQGDYTDPEVRAANPAFVFADDYDPEDEEKCYAFEKVIPEGGQYIIDVNNYGGYGATDTHFSPLEMIWNAITGYSGHIYVSSGINMQTLVENENLNKTKLKFINGRINGVRYVRAVCAYTPSDIFQRYAYYYQQALESENAEAIEYHNTVVDALLYTQVPSIKKEQVLINYYSDLVSSSIEHWVEMIDE